MPEATISDMYSTWDEADFTWDEALVPWEAQPDPDGARTVAVLRENRIVAVSPEFKR